MNIDLSIIIKGIRITIFEFCFYNINRTWISILTYETQDFKEGSLLYLMKDENKIKYQFFYTIKKFRDKSFWL